jgi:nucleoid-associated protein YgaU
MALTPLKVILFLLGGTVAAGTTAYFAGVFDTWFEPATPQMAAPATEQPAQPDQQIAALPPADEKPAGTSPAEAQPPAAETEPAAPAHDAPAADVPAAPAPAEPAAAGTAPAAPEAVGENGVIPPTFDLVRVEPDGSIVVAGKAGANCRIEIIAGSRVLGTATSGPEGDFAIVLDDPLKPGAYQLVLRSTNPANIVAMSLETAVVSVPDTPEGQVLALVEKPGAPAELITVPKPEQPASEVPEAGTGTGDAAAAPDAGPAASEAGASGEPKQPAPETAGAPEGAGQPATEGAPGDQDVAAASPAPDEPQAPAPQAPSSQALAVEAVEIEGRMIFVAGVAEPGQRLRVYANDIFLGETIATQGGRFLVETERDLPVGDYIIRVDALDEDGVKVLARAAVPFEREPGENIAAVAPPAQAAAPQAPAAEGAAPATAGAAPAQPPAAQPGSDQMAAAPADPSAPQPEGSGSAATPAPAAAPAAPAPAQGGASTDAPPQPAAPGSTDMAAAPAPAPAGEPGASDAAAGGAAAPATSDAGTAAPAAPAAAGTPDATTGGQEQDMAAAPASEPGDVVTGPKLQSVDGAVIIRRGDTLWRISRRVYGRGTRYSTIYLANQDQIRNPDLIWPGQVFKVPETSRQGEQADMTGLGDQAVKIVPYSATP